MNARSQKLKTSLLIAGVLLTCGMAQAQSSGKTDSTQHRMHHWSPRNGANFGHSRHGNSIRYTPEQRRQLMAINKEYHDKSADLFKKDNITLREYKAGLLALQKDKSSKTEALLTPQQKEQTARRKKMAEENRQVAEAGRMERLKLRLKLSDDQVSKIKAGQEGLRTQVKSIHDNDNLLPQEKMEQMKGLMAKRKDVFKSVLTPEQYTQFEQMMQHRRGFGHEGHEGPGGRPGWDRGRHATEGNGPEGENVTAI
jgi:Spy/CpxP family protein refolding chaperone